MKHYKESLFGNNEQVKQISKCFHDWKPKRGILFNYMLVFAKCDICKTWFGIPEGYKLDKWLIPND